MNRLKMLLIALLCLIPVLAFATAKTKLTPSEFMQIMSQRTWNVRSFGTIKAPVTDDVVVFFQTDRKCQLKGYTATIGSLTSTTAPTLILQKNGSTISGSTMTFATDDADWASHTVALNNALVPGDIVTALVGVQNVTTPNTKYGAVITCAEDFN